MKKRNIMVLFVAVLLATIALAIHKPNRNRSTTSTIPRNYLTVVNTASPYNFNGIYQENLVDDLAVTKNDENGEEELLEYKTLEAFHKLRSAARKKGIVIGLMSGYHSRDDQSWRYNYLGEERPGYSEHHTGLNITIGLIEYLPNGEGPYLLKEGDKIPENEELTKLLPDYGFIRRYPEGKEDITGHAAPYEIRFVGDAETAHAIMDHNLCLEEYTGTNKNCCG